MYYLVYIIYHPGHYPGTSTYRDLPVREPGVLKKKEV